MPLNSCWTLVRERFRKLAPREYHSSFICYLPPGDASAAPTPSAQSSSAPSSNDVHRPVTAEPATSKPDEPHLVTFWGGGHRIKDDVWAISLADCEHRELHLEYVPTLLDANGDWDELLPTCAGASCTDDNNLVFIFSGIYPVKPPEPDPSSLPAAAPDKEKEIPETRALSPFLVKFDLNTMKVTILNDIETSPGQNPSHRAQATLTYVPAHPPNPPHPSLYLFGGLQESGSPTNEVHVYSLQTNQWSKAETEGIPPSPRNDHTAVYYAPKHCIYIYGGTSRRGERDLAREGDMHILTLDNMKWRLIPLFDPPPPRGLHTATCYGNKMIIFGGREPPQAGVDHRSIVRPSGDVYVFNMDSDRMEVLPRSLQQKRPDSRGCHTACMLNTVMYVFGGSTSPAVHAPTFQNFKNDLWRLEVFPPLPVNGEIDVTPNGVREILVKWTDTVQRMPDERYRVMVRRLLPDGTPVNKWYIACTGTENECRIQSTKEMLIGPSGSSDSYGETGYYEVAIVVHNFAGLSSYWQQQSNVSTRQLRINEDDLEGDVTVKMPPKMAANPPVNVKVVIDEIIDASGGQSNQTSLTNYRYVLSWDNGEELIGDPVTQHSIEAACIVTLSVDRAAAPPGGKDASNVRHENDNVDDPINDDSKEPDADVQKVDRDVTNDPIKAQAEPELKSEELPKGEIEARVHSHDACKSEAPLIMPVEEKEPHITSREDVERRVDSRNPDFGVVDSCKIEAPPVEMDPDTCANPADIPSSPGSDTDEPTEAAGFVRDWKIVHVIGTATACTVTSRILHLQLAQEVFPLPPGSSQWPHKEIDIVYKFRVAARNEGGLGPFSEEAVAPSIRVQPLLLQRQSPPTPPPPPREEVEVKTPKSEKRRSVYSLNANIAAPKIDSEKLAKDRVKRLERREARAKAEEARDGVEDSKRTGNTSDDSRSDHTSSPAPIPLGERDVTAWVDVIREVNPIFMVPKNGNCANWVTSFMNKRNVTIVKVQPASRSNSRITGVPLTLKEEFRQEFKKRFGEELLDPNSPASLAAATTSSSGKKRPRRSSVKMEATNADEDEVTKEGETEQTEDEANEEGDRMASGMDVDVKTDSGSRSGLMTEDVREAADDGISAVKDNHAKAQEAEFTDASSAVLGSSSRAKERKASTFKRGRARKKARTDDSGIDEQSPESDSDDDLDVDVKPIPAASGPLTSWKKVMKKFYPDWGMLDSSMPEFVKKLLVELELKPTSVGGKGEWGIPESLHGYLIYRLSESYGSWNDDPIEMYEKPLKSTGRKPAGISAAVSSKFNRKEEVL
ncbi:hypothetical protein SeLEV6574_g07951 [Synchytrium endobioticum]|uniref:Uncharacterized protein n=1 Tax=Synchytrium endobioticum TaxID=286115 RepID=A0A507CCN5_9FUNG|nr:hypothetical protein SeLEV6574_g07951 [Synchytrium endobioticum]